MNNSAEEDNRLTTENNWCPACKTAPAEPSATERFLAIIDRVARPTLSVPPAWAIGQMAGSA
jgi:hypothetical protein